MSGLRRDDELEEAELNYVSWGSSAFSVILLTLSLILSLMILNRFEIVIGDRFPPLHKH